MFYKQKRVIPLDMHFQLRIKTIGMMKATTSVFGVSGAKNQIFAKIILTWLFANNLRNNTLV